MRASIASAAGNGAAADVGALQHDGSALSEFRSAETAVTAELAHLRQLEAEIESQRAARARLEQRVRNIQIAIGSAIAVGVIVVLVLISKVA